MNLLLGSIAQASQSSQKGVQKSFAKKKNP